MQENRLEVQQTQRLSQQLQTAIHLLSCNAEELTSELRKAAQEGGDPDNALGETLFAAVRVAAALQEDPETSLHQACERFIARFAAMEAAAEKPLRACSPDELRTLWNTQNPNEPHLRPLHEKRYNDHEQD